MKKHIPRNGSTTVQSVERAIDIITYVATSGLPSLTDIGRQLGLSNSTVHRLLASLQAKGAVQKDSANRYCVGPLAFRWTGSPLHQGALAALVLPFLQGLRDDTNETASFHILVGRHHICVEQVESPHELRRTVEMGKGIPLGLGATGKAILAHLPGGEREAIVELWNAQGLPRIDPQAFEEELSRVRDRGVALSLGERLQGGASASAPVFNGSGRVVGAVSLSGPASRLPFEVLEAYAQLSKEVAACISRELGYRMVEQPVGGSRASTGGLRGATP